MFRTLASSLALVILAMSPAGTASAERVKQNSKKADAAFDACMDAGSAMVDHGDGVTSCFHNDHGIVCGGPKPEHKGTCDTFLRFPKHPDRLSGPELARIKMGKRLAR